MIKMFVILLVLLRFSDSKLVGTCNQCLASNEVACLNENHFSICFQGNVTETITKCPENYVCTSDELICRPSVEGYKPICYNEYCGECEITKGIFTCVDDITYGYCFGGNTPLESTLRSCPEGYVCNYNNNNREICVPSKWNKPSCPTKTLTTEISIIPTDPTVDETNLTTPKISTPTVDEMNLTTTMISTPTVDETSLTITTISMPTVNETALTTTTISTPVPQTTTVRQMSTEAATTKETITTTADVITQETSPITETITTTATSITELYADDICRLIRDIGYFESDDPTCRQYVYCYLLSGQYLGFFYYCDFYFNAATKRCQVERPPNCIPHYNF